jgi:hypothetical protein
MNAHTGKAVGCGVQNDAGLVTRPQDHNHVGLDKMHNIAMGSGNKSLHFLALQLATHGHCTRQRQPSVQVLCKVIEDTWGTCCVSSSESACGVSPEALASRQGMVRLAPGWDRVQAHTPKPFWSFFRIITKMRHDGTPLVPLHRAKIHIRRIRVLE